MEYDEVDVEFSVDIGSRERGLQGNTLYGPFLETSGFEPGMEIGYAQYVALRDPIHDLLVDERAQLEDAYSLIEFYLQTEPSEALYTSGLARREHVDRAVGRWPGGSPRERPKEVIVDRVIEYGITEVFDMQEFRDRLVVRVYPANIPVLEEPTEPEELSVDD